MDSANVTSKQLASLGSDERAAFMRYRRNALKAFQDALKASEKACCIEDPLTRKEWDSLAHSRVQSAEAWDWLAMYTLGDKA